MIRPSTFIILAVIATCTQVTVFSQIRPGGITIIKVVDGNLTLTTADQNVVLSSPQAGTVGIRDRFFGAVNIYADSSANLSINMRFAGTESANGVYQGFKTTTLTTGALILDGLIDSASVSLVAGTAIGGNGSIIGSLNLAAGSRFLFDPNAILQVSGPVALDPTFGVDDLIGLDPSIATGTYTIIGSTQTDFSSLGIENYGVANAYDLGNGKHAYFENGSLNLVVIPEPASALGIGVTVLLVGAFRRRQAASS